ncbi:glycoside hydrolase family 43 protein [Promicromonospora panici]|uniref:glycoside hydrolase family 43 protein n=1 Tax=Promicromonospora panici TaxID=2219658 RepID=UPI00101BB013|nr:glycoside hydrolase family 43 protein [Promicromonospora panici]
MRIVPNPVLPGCHPDPSVCRVGEDYFLVTSTFSYHPGIPVHHSRDLVTWRLVGHVLDGESWLPLEGNTVSHGVWAPTIRHHDGVFYVVFTVVRGDEGATTYVATTTDPSGRWTVPTPLEADGIDPSLFFDQDGRAWFTAARDAVAPDATGPGEIWMRELDLGSLTLVGPTRILWHGALTGQWVEAPHIYERDGRYHLIGAEGGTGRNHAVTAATSDSVTGPYTTDPRSPLLTHRHLGSGEAVQYVGHADLVESPDGEAWALLLGVRPVAGHHTLGREVLLVPVEWDEHGPVLAPGAGRVQGVLPGLPDTASGPADWVSLRGPVVSEVADGAVTLHPQPVPLSGRGIPAFLGRRQDMHGFVFETLLATEHIGEHDAGVVALQDENTFLAARVRRRADGCVVRVTGRMGGAEVTRTEVPVAGDVVLRIRSDGRSYEFVAGTSDGEHLLAAFPHTALSTETAGGFVGVLLGVVNEAPEDAGPLTFRGVRYDAP